MHYSYGVWLDSNYRLVQSLAEGKPIYDCLRGATVKVLTKSCGIAHL